jgi:hypothetical protein
MTQKLKDLAERVLHARAEESLQALRRVLGPHDVSGAFPQASKSKA